MNPSVVMFENHKGKPVGTGFLIDQCLIATCSHVVNSALTLEKMSSIQPPQHSPVMFRFASVDRKESKVNSGWVARWLPPQHQDHRHAEDIALIAFEPNDSVAGRAPLRPDNRKIDYQEELRIEGFPEKHPDGLVSPAFFNNCGQNRRMMCSGPSNRPLVASPGQSGSPVFRRRGDGVIGMMRGIRAEADFSYVIPIGDVINVWPFWSFGGRDVNSGVSPDPEAKSAAAILAAFAEHLERHRALPATEREVFQVGDMTDAMKSRLCERILPPGEQPVVFISASNGRANGSLGLVVAETGIYWRNPGNGAGEVRQGLTWSRLGQLSELGGFRSIEDWGICFGSYVDLDKNDDVPVSSIILSLQRLMSD